MEEDFCAEFEGERERGSCSCKEDCCSSLGYG